MCVSYERDNVSVQVTRDRLQSNLSLNEQELSSCSPNRIEKSLQDSSLLHDPTHMSQGNYERDNVSVQVTRDRLQSNLSLNELELSSCSPNRIEKSLQDSSLLHDPTHSYSKTNILNITIRCLCISICWGN